MKQPHRFDDSFRIPRPVRSDRNARPAVVVVLVAVTFALLVILLAEVGRIVIEGMHR